MMATTIRLDKKVRDRLKELKLHPRESYNAVLERLIELGMDRGVLSINAIRDIGLGLEDVRAGRTLSMTEVKQRLKMK